jgi:hypothetical protein
MKRYVILILILMVAFIGCQKVEEAEASGDWNPCDTRLSAIFNDCVDQDDPRAEIGVGTDVKLWEHEKFTIDQETRLNLNGYGGIDEGDVATYTVFKPKMEKGLLQTIGDFLSGLFNKGE